MLPLEDVRHFIGYNLMNVNVTSDVWLVKAYQSRGWFIRRLPYTPPAASALERSGGFRLPAKSLQGP
jgi:hypothetical protein